MDEPTQKTIHDTTMAFLQLLSVEATVALSEKDGAVVVSIDTPEPGALIGHYGRSLEALQVLLGQIVYKQLGQWVRLSVTVGDYKERRAQQLTELAARSAEKVIETQTEVELTELTPAERRIIHLALSDHPQVVSESSGEGRDRKLIIKLRT